ncbi:Protein of unknown function, partial [Gryllus bimaculatus]
MAKLLMMSELSGDVLTHRSRRCFSVYSLSSLQHDNSGCSDDHFCDDQNLCAHACSQCPADVHVIVYLYYTCKLTKMLRFVLLVSVAATATAFPQRFEEKNIPFGILKMHMKINRSHKKKLVSKIVFNSSVPENIFLINQ